EAVRSGPWKLAVAPQSEHTGKEKPVAPGGKAPFVPKLYDLAADPGESTDVAADHPTEVKRLQDFAAAMDADLGVTKAGPGVRAPGRVAHPAPLLLK
ncbi:MAG TPA: arylsulfatase, partial [Planctomycetota bacterium]|nr:arylsulfatase [Planctomycetota bacterium]